MELLVIVRLSIGRVEDKRTIASTMAKVVQREQNITIYPRRLMEPNLIIMQVRNLVSSER